MVYRQYLTEEIRRVRAKVAEETDPYRKSVKSSYLNRLLIAYRQGVPKSGNNSQKAVVSKMV